MGKSDVVITMSAQDAQVVAAWQRMKKDIGEVGDKMEQTGKKGRKSAEASDKSFTKLVGTFKRVALGIAGAGQAVVLFRQLVTKELDAVRTRQQRFASESIGFAGALAGAIGALGDVGGTKQQQIQAENQLVSELQKGTVGFSRTDFALASIPTLSSRGTDFTAKQAINTQREIARLRPDLGLTGNIEGLGQLTRGALQVRKEFPEVSAKIAAGGLIGALSKAIQSDPGKFAETTVAQIGPLVKSFDPEATIEDADFILRLLIATGQTVGDPKGRRTATGVIRQSVKDILIKAAPTLKERGQKLSITNALKFAFDPNDPEAAKLRATAAGPFAEQRDVLLAKSVDPRFTQQEQLGFQGEARFIGAGLQLFQPGSDLLQKFRRLEELNIGFNEPTARLAGEQAARLRGREEFITAQIAIDAQSARNKLLAGGTPTAVRGQLIKEGRDLLLASRFTATEIDAVTLLARTADRGGDPERDLRVAAGVMRSFGERRLRTRALGTGIGTGGMPFAPITLGPLNERSQTEGNTLIEFADRLIAEMELRQAARVQKVEIINGAETPQKNPAEGINDAAVP